MMTSIAYHSVSQIQQSLDAGDYSSGELLDAMLARISASNTSLNAIVTLDEEQARQKARTADQQRAKGQNLGLLHGIPITIKDSFQTAGMRTTSGFPPLKNYIPDKDAFTVARLKAAGAIIIGKTNLPTLAGDFQCKNPIFGRSNNPWDVTRTTGGSTGGGAAAIASGMGQHRWWRCCDCQWHVCVGTGQRPGWISAGAGTLLRGLRFQTRCLPGIR